MKRIIFSGLVIVAVSTLVYLGSSYFLNDEAVEQNTNQASETESPIEVGEQNMGTFNKQMFSLSDPTSLWIVVNKSRPISTEYIPADLRDVEVAKRTDKSRAELQLRDEVASALEAMFDVASNEGLNLLLGSAYRSAELQELYYTNYVNAYGQAEADKFSARPGTSEHQLGLAADVSPVDQTCYLETCFSSTPEGIWVADNAHKFGFVIRYPEGKEDITGYQFEPWHLRYVGTELAGELFSLSQTIEEFFDL